MAPFQDKYLTSYVMALVMFALSLNICEIFSRIIKCRKSELRMECQGQVDERKLRHSTGNIGIHIGIYFRILATWQQTFTQNVTQIQTYKQGGDYRQNLQRRFT